ncbi:MAG: heme-degrading domain-containing protein [bacterium]|nr:heme-degrading domain-containing protein [bacterium]
MSEEKEKTLEEVMKILELQEEILQFTHFTNADAWELGNIMVAEAKKRELPVAISIRLNNGLVVFQYMFDGKTPMNEDWIRRKFNTVRDTESSSLFLYTKLEKTERTMQDVYMDEHIYANSGGGFPIRIEEVGVIGAVIVSGLNHVADHDLVIKCLSKYLHTDEVPRIKDAY